MSLTAFVDGQNRPVAEAALEQITLLLTTWSGNPADTQNVLDICGGGLIVTRSFDLLGLPPVWMHLVQGDKHYVLFAGSATTLHWAMNATGAIAVVPDSLTVIQHGFFARAWSQLRPKIVPSLPVNPLPGQLFLSGHSYGGALAQLAGNDFAATYGPSSVSVMTFGQPKAMTVGFKGVQPSVYVRLVNTGDVVPYLPPASPLAISVALFPGQLLTGPTPYTWVHYGAGWKLSPDGSLDPDPGEYQGGWLDMSNAANIDTKDHSLYNYAGRLATGIVRAG